MKQIQEWLGHSDIATTANIYSRLDTVTNAGTGAAMSNALVCGEYKESADLTVSTCAIR